MADTGMETIVINATPERILEVINDVEGMPERMDAFHQADVLERDQQGRPKRAEFTLDARLKVLHYILEYEYPPNGVRWVMVEGDPKDISGGYDLEPDGAATKVTYTYSIDAGFPVPGFLRRQGVKMMADAALKDLKRNAES